MTFEEFAGAWEISSIRIGLNGVQLYPEGLAITRFRFNATAGDFGGNLAITRLDGTDIPYLTSSFNEADRNSYIQLLGSSYSNGYDDSLPCNYAYCKTNYVDQSNANNNYTVHTVLKRLPDDTIEDVNMAAGTWRIVSASLRVLIPVPSSNYLSWTQDLERTKDELDHMYAYTLEFRDDHDFNHTGVILWESAAKSYEAVASNVLETPRTNTAGMPINFQQIVGSGSLP